MTLDSVFVRRALKLAALVGGIGALAWSMRNRVRIAISRGDAPDPEYHIIEPEPADARPTTPEETSDQVTDVQADEESDSHTEGDSDNPG